MIYEKARNQENAEKLEQLRSYLAQGYLLHGSKQKLEVIKPRQSTDDDPERISGKSLAVYAADSIATPILKALFAKKDLEKEGWRSAYTGDKDHLVVTGENCTLTPGYVHVLPRDSFKEEHESSADLISYSPVTPIDVIEVDPSILDELTGLEIRLEN